MKTSTVLQHFGSTKAVGKALNIRRQAVEQWGEYVPENSARRLAAVTLGKLRVDERYYDRLRNSRKAA